MKKLLTIVGIVVVVLLLIAVILPHIVDVNHFKPEIQTQITDALGRQVTIGNIELAIFSGGVKVDDVVIADDPNFSPSPFLQAKEVKVGVALLPLIFSHRLEVSSFTVTDPQVSLLRSPSGQWNFSTMGAGGAKGKKSENSSAPTNIAVAELKISNGTITVGNTGSHQKTQTYKSLDLEASDLSYTTQFPFKFSAKTPGDGSVKLEGKAGPIDATDAALTPLDATIEVKNFDLSAAGMVEPNMGAAGLIDFNGNIISDGKEMQSKGSLKATKIKLKPAGSPASVPVDIDYDTAYDLKKQAGTLKQGDVHIGKALAKLTGSYDLAGATPTLNMKMNGAGMPIADLEGMLPAAAVSLPPGASLKSGSLDLDLTINGPTDKLIINGPVKLTDGKIGGFSIKSKLASFPGMGGSKGGNDSDTEIQLLSADVHVEPAGTQATNVNVIVPSIGTVTGTANVSADGKLDCKMNAKLAGAMGSVMTLGNKNSQGVPFTVTGTTSNPVFLPDVAGMAGNMAKGAVAAPENAAKAATGAMGGLFGKKKN